MNLIERYLLKAQTVLEMVGAVTLKSRCIIVAAVVPWGGNY